MGRAKRGPHTPHIERSLPLPALVTIGAVTGGGLAFRDTQEWPSLAVAATARDQPRCSVTTGWG